MFFDGEPVELVVDPAKAQSMIPRQLAVSIGLVIENAELVEPSSEHADILDTTEVEDIVLGGRVIGPYEVWVCDDCHGNLGFLGTQLMDLLHMSIDTERRVAFMAQCDHGADRL